MVFIRLIFIYYYLAKQKQRKSAGLAHNKGINMEIIKKSEQEKVITL